jgi:hypothetical protein
MKSFDYYRTVDIPCPAKSAYITIYVYSKGEILWQGRGANLAEVREQYPDALIESHFDEEAYNEEVKVYNSAISEKENEFIEDLFEEFDVTDNPKRELCYSIAYADGHAHGFSEIYGRFSDIVDLIK